MRKKFEQFEKQIEEVKLKLKSLELEFAKDEVVTNAAKLHELQTYYEAEKKALSFVEQEYEAVFNELAELNAI